jgi:hypothetical protein
MNEIFLPSYNWTFSRTVCQKTISKESIKMTFFRIFSMSAILGNFRGGYHGIKVIPKKASMEG